MKRVIMLLCFVSMAALVQGCGGGSPTVVNPEGKPLEAKKLEGPKSPVQK
jgi:hypothetical protein